jgi:iron only hydrogenase large subunit-like protein
VKFAVVDGIANVRKVDDAAFVEVNACPGGCVAGGGSPSVSGKEEIAKRVAAVLKLGN